MRLAALPSTSWSPLANRAYPHCPASAVSCRRAATPIWLCRSSDGQGPGGPTAPGTPDREAYQRQPALEDLDPDVWKSKPWWCQPYSIVGTGTAFVAGVWAISGRSTGWTVASALPIAAWWFLFLAIYPAQFREYVEDAKAQQRLQQMRRQQQQQER